jgi:GTP-binding protein HflX
VLADIGAVDVPELIVVNKADAADPAVIDRLVRGRSDVVVVSARTGAGLDELRQRIAADLPRPEIEVDLLVPYSRGDVVARLHAHADVQSLEHTVEGTRVAARVPGWMVGEVAAFADAGSPA